MGDPEKRYLKEPLVTEATKPVAAVQVSCLRSSIFLDRRRQVGGISHVRAREIMRLAVTPNVI